MTLTPRDLASDSIAAPTPESMGSTRSTVAPSVMSASACVFWVASLPCAFSIVYWFDFRPAFWNAFARYGASKAVYRADVVVSGSSTPIMPFPDLAREFNWVMTEKSLVNDDALRVLGGGFAAALAPPAAIVTVIAAQTATQIVLLSSLIGTSLSIVPRLIRNAATGAPSRFAPLADALE